MDYTNKGKEQGNVLFLILIAVALFAALSYAVTQSTRGGGNADDETSLISSASLTQYPASLKTTLLRMSISDGVSDDNLNFNPPSDDTDCAVGDTATNTNCVFHSFGGGASYQLAPSNVTSGTGEWRFNMNNEVENIGADGADGTTVEEANAEVIAFLADVTDNVCRKLNQELGITTGTVIPVETGIDVSTLQDDAFSFSAGGIIDDNTSGDLEGQPFGCFVQGGTNYYYHTLSEN